MSSSPISPDPKLDLVLERIVDVPRRLVWAAWTTPEHITKWFTPAPWTTTDCEIDLRPGGIFQTVMRSPEGQEFPNAGCYLEIEKEEKLVWTSALGPGFRPAAAHGPGDLLFTAMILLESVGERTKYTAFVMHGDEASCRKHASMGFHQGWGAALDQLVAYVKSI
jgi:uncharacterized protein YndB with AHSA1/START domain